MSMGDRGREMRAYPNACNKLNMETYYAVVGLDNKWMWGEIKKIDTWVNIMRKFTMIEKIEVVHLIKSYGGEGRKYLE